MLIYAISLIGKKGAFMTLDESITVLDQLISVVSSLLITIYGTAAIFKVAKIFLTF